MHTLLTHLRTRRSATTLACVLLASVLLVLTGPSSVIAKQTPVTTEPGGAGGSMLVAPQPAPPKQAPPAPAREQPATQPTTDPPPRVKVTPTRVVPPPLSAKDKEALGKVDFWWDVFAQSIREHQQGTRLTAAQLKKPAIVIVKKSSCRQPTTNVLGPKSRKSLTYCKGKLELVPSVFLTITDGGQLKVVASGFLYHALATTPGKLRQWRNNAQVLGCLQASLSIALRHNQVIATEDEAWAVMRDYMGGGDLHNSYFATVDNNGQWR